MDRIEHEIDFETLLTDLVARLEAADPAEAPTLAAAVAEELQRRLRG